MATKRTAKSSSNNMDWMKWLYVAGVVVAGVSVAAGFTNQYLTWALILAGLVVGFWYFDSADVEHFGLRYVILGAVVGAKVLSEIPQVGGYVDGFLSGFFWFLGPVVLAQIIMFFYHKYFSM